jgi:hypothetical protein
MAGFEKIMSISLKGVIRIAVEIILTGWELRI